MRRYGVDAAVLFSDIVVPAHAIGFGIDVAPGTGPVVAAPLRSAGRLARLRPLEPDDVAVRRRDRRTRRRRARTERAGAGFAGAPFTVASYLIEGGPSRTYEHTKALMHTDEAALARR